MMLGLTLSNLLAMTLEMGGMPDSAHNANTYCDDTSGNVNRALDMFARQASGNW